MFSDETGGFRPNGYRKWKDEELKNINNVLIEFFVFVHKSGDLNSANSYENYFQSLQKAFKVFYDYDLNLTSGTIFHNPGSGLYFFMDNICKDMKAQGKTSKSHNFLSTNDVSKLYESDVLFKEDPLGGLKRLIFYVALVMSWRP